MTSEAFPIVEKIRHSQLTLSARQSLSGNWTTAVIVAVIIMIISGAASILPVAGPIIISGPLAIGMARFSLEISRNKHSTIETAFSGFNQFGQGLIAYLLGAIAMILGFVLLVIPGIIIALGLSQTFYILADNPKMSGVDALRESWEMMDGHKGDYFVFLLRFIGWMILCVFTLFIGFLWLYPYIQVSVAKFHDMIKTGGHPDDLDSPITKHLVDEDLV